MTITEFLLARIEEDEAVAKECAEMFPPPWDIADRGWCVRIYSADVPDTAEYAEDDWVRTPCVIEVEPTRFEDKNDPVWLGDRVAHIARHDPARVLAECETKRQIVELHHPHDHHGEHGEYVFCSVCQWDHGDDSPRIDAPIEDFGKPCDTLRTLATIYKDHPNYDKAWRL